jgi:hypothetical protein
VATDSGWGKNPHSGMLFSSLVLAAAGFRFGRLPVS